MINIVLEVDIVDFKYKTGGDYLKIPRKMMHRLFGLCLLKYAFFEDFISQIECSRKTRINNLVSEI